MEKVYLVNEAIRNEVERLMVKVIKVVAAIIREGDQVLITRRAPNQSFAGGWEFPGGKVEATETEQECLVRELKEELNIEVAVGDYCSEVVWDYGTFGINLIAYYCSIVNGEIETRVHDTYRWAKINDLLNYDLLPADVPIAKKIQEHEYI